MLLKTLEEYGDSVVVAGSEKLRRIHLHTNVPSELFDNLRKTGIITFQKADDMVRHYQIANERKWKIALVTDSTCDLSQELIDNYQVNVLPLNINFGENHYLDKVTLQPEQFYKLLSESSENPKTSQINENTFINLYSHLASHYDSVIAVHLSDKLSGTFFSSQKAARKISAEFGKPITVLNSKNLSGSLGLIILRTAQSIENGFSHDEVVSMAEKWIQNTRIFVSVKNLKYMVRGGRVSATKGLI
ncbi:MAG: DegV family protein, partial [Bacteroidia bacterium]